MKKKNRQVQVGTDPVNHCDPQLIDLFGAKDLDPEAEALQGTTFQNLPFFVLTAENLEVRVISCLAKIQKPNDILLALSVLLCSVCELKVGYFNLKLSPEIEEQCSV